MTYCIGAKLEEGLLFASDTRTNAGVDSVATFRKLFLFQRPAERLIVILTAGNLAVTQEVITRLQQGLGSEDPGRDLLLAPTLFDATALVGTLFRAVIDRDRGYLQAFGADVTSSFIVGGQIQGDEPRLFLVYSAGNFIETDADTPYFQFGETKYGKPILERVLKPHITLLEAAKCSLLSFDSTMQANLSVAPPIDLLLYRRDSLRVACQRRIQDDDVYLMQVRQTWSEGLKRVFSEVTNPPWPVDQGT